jgi:cell division septation protein DedD
VKNKETGEFELVVGNAQIISGFFILALLLAVFFAMGFIVARAKYQQEPATAAAAVSQPQARPEPPAAAPPTPAAAGSPEQPASDSGSAPPADTSAKLPAEPEKPPQPAEAAPEPAPAEAAAGTYWQVTATKDPAAARAMLQSMKDMGLPASLSPGPNDFTRVLVGPYNDTATMAKVKTQLENAGLHPVKHAQ